MPKRGVSISRADWGKDFAMEGSGSWLDVLPPIATLVSAFLGFLGGTLINHVLAMRRSDRERYDEQIDICQGLIAEIAANRLYIDEFLSSFDVVPKKEAGASFERPITRFYELTAGRTGFLGWEIAAEIHWTFSSLMAFGEAGKRMQYDYALFQQLRIEMDQWSKDSYLTENRLFEFQKPILRRGDRKAWNVAKDSRVQS